MGYFQPIVIYRNPNESREHSIIRYIGNRVLTQNKNFLCALTGGVGQGKSYSGLKICELYSQMFNIPFDPSIHVIGSLKELLLLITSKDVDKKIQFGSIIMFDEPQVEANARNFQSDMNQAFSQLISTFRNQRLVVLFATPRLDMLDKQSRILFHGDFKIMGFDKNTKITNVQPRFLEYNSKKNDFLRKRLIIQYKTPDKIAMNITKLHTWHLPIASDQTINIYEAKKKAFTDDLNKKLLSSIELQEKQMEGKNKSDELFKVRELFNKFGEDYERILEEMPHLSPFAVEKYIYFIKKSRKLLKNSHPYPQK
jgi:hypothetical protein